ncbi:MAG: SO_0444 family Cu/Zn efflux transporter [Candidatus Eiseniibacteriota bacterium]|jgi:hypothetical protein
MIDFLLSSIAETARIVYEGALYILVGFFVAGLLHEFLSTHAIARHLGPERPRSVALAALFGAPIPLCSCGVLPAAAALREKGASRPSVLSFLISTPETGVDSIALTWALLGPLMAIVRPLVAIATGIVAGLAALVGRPGPEAGAATTGHPPIAGPAPPTTTTSVAAVPGDAGGDDAPMAGDCCRAPEPPASASTEDDGCCDASADDCCDASAAAATAGPAAAFSWRTRSRRALRYGFVTLLDEIGFWLVVGIALTGVLSALLPDDFFTTVLGWDRGIVPMLAMMVAGVPLYLCASASTPVAAALIAKGLSPGAALVFLLVGPATNATTMTVVARILGNRYLRVYLGSIILVSLAAGLLLDAVAADAVRLGVLSSLESSDPAWVAAIKVLAAFVLAFLLIVSFRRGAIREGLAEAGEQFRRLVAASRDLRWHHLLRRSVLVPLLVLLALAVAASIILIVQPGQHGILQLGGRVVGGPRGPGLYLHWPPPLGRGLAVDVDRVRQVPVGFRGPTTGERPPIEDQAFYVTADENIIDLRAVVHYTVDDAVRFALGIESPDRLIAALARRDLVEIAARMTIDVLYTTARRSAEQTLRELLVEQVETLDIGCRVVDARLLDVHAPATVHDAFRDVASALEDRERSIHDANGYAARTEAGAAGEAAGLLAGARADSTTAIQRARGTADAFRQIAAAHARGPRITETRLHLETLERALAAPRKYVHAGQGGEIDLWIGGGPAGSPVELFWPEALGGRAPAGTRPGATGTLPGPPGRAAPRPDGDTPRE